ncbi:hypothetical protein M3Y99_01905100 [Aphelenchoides fujianensis]|nr:hypothetical protein M3Y99_01905100 [Aphelenchoides fujianensis]
MRGEWTAQRGDFWKAAGGLVLDRLHLHDNWTGGDDTPQVFAVESAQLMVGKLIHFSAETVDHEPVFLSDEIIQRALRAGALSVYRTYENSYRTNCSGTIEARVRAGDQEFAFSIASDWDGKSSCDLYIGRISFFGAWNHDVAYTNTPTVIFPLSFNENCLVYDYANQTISLAES